MCSIHISRYKSNMRKTVRKITPKKMHDGTQAERRRNILWHVGRRGALPPHSFQTSASSQRSDKERGGEREKVGQKEALHFQKLYRPRRYVAERRAGTQGERREALGQRPGNCKKQIPIWMHKFHRFHIQQVVYKVLLQDLIGFKSFKGMKREMNHQSVHRR